MKTHGLLMIVALAVALIAAPASAQQIDLRADVPFAFTAAGAQLDAGRCVVQTIVNNAIVLRDSNRHNALVLVGMDRERSADSASLVFHRYGDRYFLAQIKTPTAIYQAPMGKHEQQLARKGPPSEVAVLAHAIGESGQ